MNLKKMIVGKLGNASYKSVAAIMKKNYIGMAKKYKNSITDKEIKKLNAIVEKLNKAIDDRDREAHYKYLAKLKTEIMFIDEKKAQKGEKLICRFPTCSNEATHIDIKNSIVLCDKHFKLREHN